MEEIHLITGPACRNVESPFVGRLGERTYPFIACRDERQEYDVALIPLEAVGVPADETPPLHFFGTQQLEQSSFNQAGLRLPLQDDEAHGLLMISLVGTQLGDLARDRIGLWPIDHSVIGAFSISFFYEDTLERGQAIGSILPEGNQRRI